MNSSQMLRVGWLWILLGLSMGCQDSQLPPPEIPSSAQQPELRQHLARLREQVTRDPKSAANWGSLGRAFHSAELSMEALSCYRQAQALSPTEPSWWHLAGLLELQSDPDRGLLSLEKARSLTTHPLLDAPRLALARGLLERGRLTEASAPLTEILRSAPEHPGARLESGRIELLQNHLAEAEALLGPALSNSYTARQAHLLMAQIYQRQGRSELATDPFLKEVQLQRHDPAQMEDDANALLTQGRLTEAEKAIAELIVRFPDRSGARLLLGRLRVQQRRCPEAQTELEHHLKSEPNSLNGWMQLGMAHLCQEHWSSAVIALERAVELKPDFAQAHHNLGVALARSGDRDRAILELRKALVCSPADANTCTVLAEQLMLNREFDEARSLLEKALRINPRHPKASDLRYRLPR
jgi:protein O-GlcNAc transferase